MATCAFKILEVYTYLLARHPAKVMATIVLISSGLIAAGLYLHPLSDDDFSDPTLGFQARGTEIGSRSVAWRNLKSTTDHVGQLVLNPSDMQAQERDNLLRSMPPHQRKLYDKLGNKRKSRTRYNKPKNKPPPLKDDSEAELKNDTTADPPAAAARSVRAILNEQEVERDDSSEFPDILSEPIDTGAYDRPFSFDSDEATVVGTPFSQNNDFNHSPSTDEQPEVDREPIDSSELLHSPPRRLNMQHQTFFCSAPSTEYIRVVMQRVDRKSMFDKDTLLAMCDMEVQMTQSNGYENLCQKSTYQSSEECCRIWSATNYVALLTNLPSCYDIKPKYVEEAKALLIRCYPYYLDGQLLANCKEPLCSNVPGECTGNNAVFEMIHYASDLGLFVENGTDIFLSEMMVILPVARSTQTMDLYEGILKIKQKVDKIPVAVVAMDLGLNEVLFDDCLLQDSYLIVSGGIFIMICMWLYTRSLIVTLCATCAIVMSLGLSYFMYTVVFRMPFFPFMNLLAVIVILGIGADDAFIYTKTWKCVQAERSQPLHERQLAGRMPIDDLHGLVTVTFRHAAASMGVTTLTTAAAFLAAAYNSITAIKCFSIFAGTAVLVNYLLMISWLPAAVVLIRRWDTSQLPPWLTYSFSTMSTGIADASESVKKSVVSLVMRFPLTWFFVFGIGGCLSIGIVLVWPRLRLPESGNFPLFYSGHVFEQYAAVYSKRFNFTRQLAEMEAYRMPMRFVWGVQNVDNGVSTDPRALGTLQLNNTLNASSIEAQMWLSEFCELVRKQPFYQKDSERGVMTAGCFIETFVHYMDRPCIDPMGGERRMPCCNESTFPFEPTVFEQCLPEIFGLLHNSPSMLFQRTAAGPRFERTPLNISHLEPNNTLPVPPMRAFVIEFESTVPFNSGYEYVDRFQTHVNAWFAEQLATAPPGLKHAWFVSDLEFFDLQRTLAEDTLVSVGLAMGLGLLVLLIVTRNFLVSFFAIVTVSMTIGTTIAVLVLMDWRLNVLESIAITTAIGLTIDFSLHYGHAYREQKRPSSPEAAVRNALERLMGPTLMAALTTGVAGMYMWPSHVLAYIQIGQFLVIVMMVSWLYATFFLMSLLQLFGRVPNVDVSAEDSASESDEEARSNMIEKTRKSLRNSFRKSSRGSMRPNAQMEAIEMTQMYKRTDDADTPATMTTSVTQTTVVTVDSPDAEKTAGVPSNRSGELINRHLLSQAVAQAVHSSPSSTGAVSDLPRDDEDLDAIIEYEETDAMLPPNGQNYVDEVIQIAFGDVVVPKSSESKCEKGESDKISDEHQKLD